MTTWFTSDHHFGHRNIIDYCDRPFDSVEEMTEVMIERWNSRVGTGDIVYYGGDFSMGARRGVDLGVILERLNGVKVLMPGNHDECFKMRKKWEKWAGVYILSGFDSIIESFWADIELQGVPFRLSHFPYGEEDSSEVARFVECRPPDDGGWLICGHIHEKWKIKDRMINMGVDVWDFYPVSEEEILEVVRSHS